MRSVAPIALLLTLGCAPPPSGTATSTTTPTPTTPSGTSSGTTTTTTTTGVTTTTGPCPSDFESESIRMCLSTSASVAGDWIIDLAVSGTVSSTPPRTDLPAASFFRACDGSFVPPDQTVEIIDGGGDTWVAGFGFTDMTIPSGLIAQIAAGTSLDLHASYDYDIKGGPFGIALHDATGPLIVWDYGGLDDLQRGFGFAYADSGCFVTPATGYYTWELVDLTFTSPEDQLVTHQGELGTFQVGTRQLDVQVGLARLGSYGYSVTYGAWATTP